jgi:multidrug efflux pump subunit AcrB
MRPLIVFSLRQHVLMNLIFIGLILTSLVGINQIPVDRYPNFPVGEAHALVSYPGATAAEVERLVTQKLEEALRGMESIEFVRTTTVAGQGELFIKFDDDTDYEQLYDRARSRLFAVQNQMPTIDGKPLAIHVAKLEVDAWVPVMQMSLIAKNQQKPLTQREATELAKALRDQLELIPGVKRIQIDGDQPEHFIVELDQKKLERHRLSYAEVVQALSLAGGAPPAGTIDTLAGERLFHVAARYQTLDDIRHVIVRRDGDGTHITVGQLIREERTGPETVSQGVMISSNGRPAIMCKVLKESTANTLTIKREVVKVGEQFMREYAHKDIELIYSADSAVRIDDYIGVLVGNLIGGAILVAAALLLFLSWRSALLTLSGVLFAILVALLYFWWSGSSLNELTVVGLVLVSGMLVGDAVVVIDNIQRHREEGKNITDAVIDGTNEVFWPVINAALTTVASFLPLLLMTGVVGDFFGLLPIAVTVALLGSLFECMLMLPQHVISLEKMLGPEKLPAKQLVTAGDYLGRPGVVGWLARWYDRVLLWNLRHPVKSMLGLFLLFLVAVGVLVQSRYATEIGQKPLLKMIFFPNDASILNVALRMPPDTTKEQTSTMVRTMETALVNLGAGKIANTNGFTGMIMDAYYKPVWSHQYGFIFIELPELKKRSVDAQAILDEVRQLLEQQFEKNGVQLEITQQLDGPPVGLPVTIRVSGRGDAEVAAAARALREHLQIQAQNKLKGLIDVYDDASQQIQQISYVPRWSDLAHYGVTQKQTLDFIAGAVEGAYVGDFRRSDDDIPIRVRLDRRLIDDPSRLLQVPIINEAQGRQVFIGDVVSLESQLVPASLVRRDFQRAVTITGNFAVDSPLSPAHVTDDVQAWFKEQHSKFPGVAIHFGGEAESTGKSYRSLMQAFFLSLFIIYLLLATQFRSYVQPLLILSNVIFAFIGVFIALGIMGLGIMAFPDGMIRPERGMFTVQSFIALVGLTGVVVNDAIVLIDFINIRRAEGRPLFEALRMAGHQRMRAILLTSITTIAGLLTMAIGIPEFSIAWSPLATCFIAGLTMSTFMTLLVVPVMYLILERLKGNREPMQEVPCA